MLKKSTLFILVLLIVASFFIISYQTKGWVNFDKLHLSHFLTPLHFLKISLNEILSAKDENRKLKEQLYELIIKEKSNEELIRENARLRALLQLKEKKKEVVAIAKVIRRGSNKFLKTIWLDKGQKHGILKDMPVITPNGLVGRVILSTDEFSEVLILTDANFSVSVRVERNRIEGILSGKSTNLCTLKYIPLEEEILVGDRLITSGIDGIFPEGIKVGAVKKVNTQKGLFQEIEVIPLQSELTIEEVAVLNSLQ